MFHVEQRSSGGNQASGEELFHVEHCPAISQFGSSITQFVCDAIWIAAC